MYFGKKILIDNQILSLKIIYSTNVYYAFNLELKKDILPRNDNFMYQSTRISVLHPKFLLIYINFYNHCLFYIINERNRDCTQGE